MAVKMYLANSIYCNFTFDFRSSLRLLHFQWLGSRQTTTFSKAAANGFLTEVAKRNLWPDRQYRLEFPIAIQSHLFLNYSVRTAAEILV